MATESSVLVAVDDSRCPSCKGEFGFFNGRQRCDSNVGGCGKDFCKICLSFAVAPNSEDSKSPDDVQVHMYCKSCFQRNSLLDFSTKVDVFGPDNGAAPCILWVHGGGGCRNMFREHAQLLSSKLGYRCVLIDLPGHGARMDEPLTVDSALDVIADSIQLYCKPFNGIKPLYIGGSLGGYLGMEYVGRFPDTISSAVICMAGQDVGPNRGCAAGCGICCMRCLLPSMSEATLLQGMMQEAKKNGHISGERMRTMSLRTGMFFHQSLAQTDVLSASDPRKTLPKFRGTGAPVLFINGSLDHRDCENVWLELSGSHSKLSVYEGADHFFSHDDRFMQRFIDEVMAFAQGVFSKAQLQ